jgi:hypothetical protein
VARAPSAPASAVGQERAARTVCARCSCEKCIDGIAREHPFHPGATVRIRAPLGRPGTRLRTGDRLAFVAEARRLRGVSERMRRPVSRFGDPLTGLRARSLRDAGVPSRSGQAVARDDEQVRRVTVLDFDASSSGRPTVTPASAGLLDAKLEDQLLGRVGGGISLARRSSGLLRVVVPKVWFSRRPWPSA